MKPIDEVGMLGTTNQQLEGFADGADPVAVSFLRRLAGEVNRIQDAVAGVLFAAVDALIQEGGLPRFLT
jgi:hypothetical protein